MKKYLIFILMFFTIPVYADSFVIDSVTTLIDETQIYQATAENNYGVTTPVTLGGTLIALSRFYKILLRFPTIDDSLTALGGTADSAVVCIVVNTAIRLDAEDTLNAVAYPLLLAFVEGAGNGIDTCGADWNMYNDTAGIGACAGDSGSWNGAGATGSGDTVGARLDWWFSSAWQDSIILCDANIDAYDTLSIKVPATYVDELYNYGILIAWSSYVDGNSDGDCYTEFLSDDASNYTLRPYVTVYYSTAASTNNRRRIILSQ